MESCALNINSASSVEFLDPEGASKIEFAGFSHAIFEYVFRMSVKKRGTVENVVLLAYRETIEGIIDRMARVSVKKNGRRFFFYVYAVAKVHNLQNYEIIGRSILMDGHIRMPDYEMEMLWL